MRDSALKLPYPAEALHRLEVGVIRPQKRYQCELQSAARYSSTRLS